MGSPRTAGTFAAAAAVAHKKTNNDDDTDEVCDDTDEVCQTAALGKVEKNEVGLTEQDLTKMKTELQDSIQKVVRLQSEMDRIKVTQEQMGAALVQNLIELK